MRRLVLVLVLLIIVVGVLGGLLVGGDALARHVTENEIAKHIEQAVPGSHAKVTISSQPFLVRLGVSGKVSNIDARVTGVKIDKYHVSSVEVKVTDVKVNRGDLFQGKVRLEGIRTGTITATLSEADLVQAGLAAGVKAFSSVGASGSVSSGAHNVKITIAGLTLTLPYTALVPCVGTADIEGTSLVLRCVTHQLPPALTGSS